MPSYSHHHLGLLNIFDVMYRCSFGCPTSSTVKNRCGTMNLHRMDKPSSCRDHTNFLSTSGCEIVADATTAGCQAIHTNISACSMFLDVMYSCSSDCLTSPMVKNNFERAKLHYVDKPSSCPDRTNFPSTSGCEIVEDATTVGCQVIHTNISACSTFLQ